MSRIALKRLEYMRRYKESQRVSFDSGGLLGALGADWISDRGLTRSDVVEKMEKVFSCAETIDCAAVPDKPDLVEILRANWCKVPSVCPVCSARLQGRRRSGYSESIRAAVRRYKHKYMITFTVSDGPNLAERLDHLRISFRAWYRMGQKRRGGVRSGGESSKICAALAGVELKKSDRGAWHVHIHALVFSDEKINYSVYDQKKLAAVRRAFGRKLSKNELDSCVAEWGNVGGVVVPVSKLSREWIAASGDSVNIDCRKIVGGWLDVERQAIEVLKYSSKLASIDLDGAGVPVDRDMVELVTGTYGRRLFMALRAFRGVLKSKDEYDEKERKADYTLVWSFENGRYAGARVSMVNGTYADTLAAVGRIVGQWRRERREILQAGRGVGVAARLDGLKTWYREIIKNIWRSGVRIDFIDSVRRVVVDLPAVLAPPDPVQCELFA